ncbi:MAG: hypothetical protein NXI16_00285 [Alphaproteobacteria bacterium]|nr:hypothetical protein [Alphaproteobacteria bacterium]
MRKPRVAKTADVPRAPAKRAASPLRTKGDPGARTLMVIAATAAFFAISALMVLAAGTQLVSQWRWAFDGAVTIQIPATGDAAADTTRAAALATALEASDQVARARALGPQEIERLIEPWLGSLDGTGSIPLPRLIDVRLVSGATLDLAALERRVKSVVPEAVIDDHGRWVQGLGQLARTVEVLAVTVLALVGLAVVLAVGLAARTALALHRETVDILHLMGAEDGYVAGLLGRLVFRRTLVGGLIGLALALATLSLAGQIGSGVGAVLPPLTIGMEGWIAILTAPLTMAVISWLVARTSALAALRRRV